MPSVASVSPTGDIYVNGVLSGVKWAVNSLTFSFPTDPSFYGTYGSTEPANGFEAFTAMQQAAVRSILANYSSVINFSFTEITETATQHADLRYAESDAPSTAWAYYPSTSALGGDAWFNNSKGWYDAPVMGNYAWLTMLHETGHAMGLKHPHVAQGAFQAMPLDHDSLEYSVMSYRSFVGAGTGGYGNSDYPQTLMMYDIAALQEMYGGNYTTNSGDTVYRWDPATGREYINGVAQTAPGANKIFMTLWDGGGTDTYDFSNYTTNLSVNLQPGSWTTVSSAQLGYLGAGHYAAGNIANALLYHGNTASLIENAIGGTGSDTIIGNIANNRLTGGAGNDILDGDAGTDTAVYSGYSFQYQLVQNANGSWTITDLRGGTPDGTDTLISIEYLQFLDTLLSLTGLQPPPTVPAPAITSFSNDSNIVGDGITNDNTLTLTGTAAANSIVKVYDGATLIGTATATAAGIWTFNTAVLADGGHSFTATTTDASGNTSAPSSLLAVTIDTIAPNAPTITSFSPDTNVAGDGITNSNALTLNGTAAAGSTVKIYDGATLIGSATADANGAWSYTTFDSNGGLLMCGCPMCMATRTEQEQDNAPGPVDAGGTGTPLADGTHVFTVTATDAAGNTSVASAALTVTVDTVAPGVPTISSFSNDSGTAGDGITNDNTLTLTGAAAPGTLVKVYDGATLLGSATANGSGVWSLTTAALTDGAHGFTATATDAAGNTSAASSALNVTIDTLAPSAPSIASFGGDSGIVGDGITSDNTLTLNGTAAANSSVKVYDGATLLGTATANASGAWSFTTGVLTEGAHSFTATASDAAGNTSAASAILNVTIDTVAPSIPIIASFSNDSGTLGDGITNDNTLTLTGSAAANSVINVYDGATLLGTATANASGAWTFTTAVLTDGAHSFTATATDAAGNTSAVSTALAVTVDTIAPSVPSIASFSNDSGTIGDGVTNDNTLTLTGTAAANSTVKLYDGATLLGTTSANTSGAWTFTTATLTDGGHSLTATATDAAGNTSAASTALTVTVDTVAPSAPTISSFSNDSGTVGDGITNDNTLTLAGAAAANSVVKIYDGATQIGTTTANASGAWTFTTAALADGGHDFTATATDAAGNTSVASVALAVTVDTVAPNAPTILSFSNDSGTVGDGITNDNTLTLTGAAAANSVVKIYDGATQIGTATANASGAWTFTTAALADGGHSFIATATDTAGNTSVTSSALAVTVDTIAPSVPTIASFSNDSGTLGDAITNDNTLTLTGAAAANSQVKVYDGATLLGTVTANASGAWTYTTEALIDGPHAFTATATDVAGNTSAASSALVLTVDTIAPNVPIVASFSNDSGTAGDGITNDNTLTLTGAAAANSLVKIYDGAIQIGTAMANASGAWTFTTAALTDGGHSFTATATDAAGNTSASSAALSVTIDTVAPNVPTISSFSNDSGTAGDNVTNDNTLTLAGTAAANSLVKVYDGVTQIGTATANASGAWTFTTNTLTDGAHGFTATATDAAGNTSVASSALNVTIDTIAPSAPSITSFASDSGIIGDGLTNDNTLILNGAAAANSLVKVYDGAILLGTATANAAGAWSFTTAALSDGAHGFSVTATDAAGNTSTASTALTVTVDTVAPNAPSILSFASDSGTVGDGLTNDNTLTLTGTAAANSAVKVYDGAVLLGTATANASGAWSFTTAALSDGAHAFAATATDAAGNTGALSTPVTITVDTVAPNAPSITSFSPDSNVVGDGITNANQITLTGSAAANSLVKVYDGATLIGTVTTDASGGWNLATATLPDGSHAFTATATDAAGNTSALSAILTVNVETTAPGVPTIASFASDSGTVGDGFTNDNTLTLNGSAVANSLIKVYDGANLIGTATANASGTWTFNTSALADGAHSFTATATDTAGNTSTASAPLSVTVDTAAPNTPTITAFSPDSNAIGDGLTNTSQIDLTGNAAANSIVRIYDGATLLGSAITDAAGAWTFTTGTLTDGAHAFSATATDAAGNTSAASPTFTVAVDTTAPSAPTISSFSPDSNIVGDGVTNSNQITLAGSAAANSVVKVYDGATLLGSATANASGAWTFTTGVLTDGSHSFTASTTDAAGNTSAASTILTVTVETDAPDLPTITSYTNDSGMVGDGITNDNTLTLTGTAVANGLVKVYDGQTLIATVIADASGAWTFTTDTLIDGAHAFAATATDAAGNTSAASTTLAVTVDTVAPAAPSIASFSPDTNVVGDGVTNSNQITLAGSAAANSVVKIYDGTTLLGSTTANASGTWTFSTATLADGSHSFTATATDSAGNTGATSAILNVTVATDAPDVPTITSYTNDSGTVGDGLTNDNSLTLTGSAAANSLVKIYDGQTLIAAVTANASGAWILTTVALTDGAHAFTATATDAAGNISAASSILNVTVDTVAPDAPSIASFGSDSGITGDDITNNNTLTLTGNAVANSLVKIYDGATQIGTAIANVTGAWTFATTALADGTHNFTATATDAAGNISLSSAALAITVDTDAPNAPTIASILDDSGAVGGTTNDNTLTLAGAASPGTLIKVYDGQSLIAAVTANASGAWTFTTGMLIDGAHAFAATATDVAGNTSAVSSIVNVTVDTVAPDAPSITSFGGDSGTIGDGVTNDNTLTLNGAATANSVIKIYDGAILLGSATANAAGAWTFATAALADGTHSFTATATDTAGNTSGSSAVMAVTVDTAAPNAPNVVSISDNNGAVGDSLTNDNTLTLAGTAATNSLVKIYDGATLLGTTTANASGAWTFATGVLTDGAHAFTATATDVAENTSPASSIVNVTVDTVAPNAPSIASFGGDSGIVGDGITNDNTVTLNGTSAVNSLVKVYDGATLLGSVAADASGAWTFTTVVLTDGAHAFTATATDAAGNTGVASSALNVTIDTAAPNAPTIASVSGDNGAVSDGITNNNTLTLTGSAAANSLVKVYDGATQIGTAVANASGGWTFTTDGLTDGAHAFTATATDVAGNTSAASATLSLTVNTVAPNAPSIASFGGDSGVAGDGLTNDNTLTLTGNAVANTLIRIYSGQTLLGTALANAAGAWAFTTAALADGTHSFTATATDAAGNISTASTAFAVTVDTLAPDVPTIVSFANDATLVGSGSTNANQVTLTGSALAHSLVTVYDGATLIGISMADSTGVWTFATGVLTDGAHDFTATATDAAGNTSSVSSALQVTVDSVVTLTGDASANTLVGGNLNDTLVGLGGNDILMGLAGDDRLDGGAGDDYLDGGTGADVMIGGTGNDTYVVDNVGDVVIETSDTASAAQGRTILLKIGGTYYTVAVNGTQILLPDIDTVKAAIDYTLPNAVENLTLLTGTGNISGTGNELNNVIIGNEGNNVIKGLAGDDRLDGGAGDDSLEGGSGKDTFVFQPNFGKDTVVDFTIGTDRLEFNHTVFANFTDVMAHSVDDEHGNVVITVNEYDVITLQNVTKAMLQQNPGDFHFV